jgi:carbonic anhydrase/acetyltransferase-like protein (isoleucine patch superfamily)
MSNHLDATAFIATTAILEGDVSIGPRASVWHQAVLRGDSAALVVGARSNIQDAVVMHGDPGMPCIVGDGVSVGHRAVLHGCIVEDDALVGIGAIVLNGARLGAGCVIAAGAVVREGMDVPAGSLVVGVPGRVVGHVSVSLARRAAETRDHYLELAEHHARELAKS